jgi:hypothetical protein
MLMDTLSPTGIGNPIAGIIVFAWMANGFWCPTAPSSRNQTAPGAVRPGNFRTQPAALAFENYWRNKFRTS